MVKPTGCNTTTGELPARFDIVIQSWDTANKSTELSDYSVCTTWGRAHGKLYLLHVFRQRLNYPDLKRKVMELARRHKANRILIEDKASGTQLIQDMQAEHVFGITPYEPPPGTTRQYVYMPRRLGLKMAWYCCPEMPHGLRIM